MSNSSAGPSPLSFDVTSLIGDRVKGLQEYAPEPLEEVAVRLGMPVGQLIKLDANENPYGPTRRALNVLNAFSSYHRYPDPISRRLRQAIGRYLSIDPASILVGNGSDELIDLILRLFRPGPQGGGVAGVISCPPTFSMYQFYGVSHDLTVLEFPRHSSFQIDVDGIEALCRRDPRPRVLFVASPNNPDGQLLPRASLLRLLALPLIVVLDEAYVEFSSTSYTSLVPAHENLIVLRTFSKWAGLAGLRVGYGVFPLALMPALWRLKSPYNVNGAAQAAALATLEDLHEAKANIVKIVAERSRLLAKLSEFPFLHPHDSQANYILCRLEGLSLAELRAVLEPRGILVRYYGSPGLEDCIRITVGTPTQDDSLLAALRSLQNDQGGAMNAPRFAESHRTTNETDVQVRLRLDGTGAHHIQTGVPFLDHMLAHVAVHGLLDLDLTCTGDTEIDDHHSVEDIGIVLGQALKQALGDKAGIVRYGSQFMPMDEALALVALDFSGRSLLVYDVSIPAQRVGHFDTELVPEFLRALAQHAGLTVHVKLVHGQNTHHIIEAIFKGLGRALGQAVAVDPRRSGVPSTKGVL